MGTGEASPAAPRRSIDMVVAGEFNQRLPDEDIQTLRIAQVLVVGWVGWAVVLGALSQFWQQLNPNGPGRLISGFWLIPPGLQTP